MSLSVITINSSINTKEKNKTWTEKGTQQQIQQLQQDKKNSFGMQQLPFHPFSDFKNPNLRVLI